MKDPDKTNKVNLNLAQTQNLLPERLDSIQNTMFITKAVEAILKDLDSLKTYPKLDKFVQESIAKALKPELQKTQLAIDFGNLFVHNKQKWESFKNMLAVATGIEPSNIQ